MNEALERLVATELDRIGYDLVELRLGGSAARPALQLRIDRRDGAPVAVEDCATASRAVEARLDAELLLGERYVLEVSSPGVERPLRSPSDWRRFAGRAAKVLSPALGGREEVQILGVETENDEAVVVVRTARGEERRIPFADIRDARLAFHW